MLTLEERIALRTNAGLARERVRDRARTQASSAASAYPDAKTLADSFDGKTHPELFLPHEVFRKLVKLAFQSSPRTCQVFRDGLTPEVRRHGLPDDFWIRLESLSAAHVADLWAAADLAATVDRLSGPARELAANALALKRIEVCRSRADALAAARSMFGQNRFDRFMYEAIAVNMFHASVSVPDPQLLQDAERGSCRGDVRGEGLGVAAARNLGLAAARGEFVIFLDDDDGALPHRIVTLLAAARQSGANLSFGLTPRVVVDSSLSLPPVPTHLASPGAVGFCDVLTCAPHVNAVLVRTETLRAVGGFDEQSSHFDDWSAWLRVADRSSTIWNVNEIVAEWRLHANGLSGQLLAIRAMKARLIALFDRLGPCLSADNARGVAIARRVVLDHEITTYDDYVRVVAESRHVLHSGGICRAPTRVASRL